MRAGRRINDAGVVGSYNDVGMRSESKLLVEDESCVYVSEVRVPSQTCFGPLRPNEPVGVVLADAAAPRLRLRELVGVAAVDGAAEGGARA
jgi:hypothetical protein